MKIVHAIPSLLFSTLVAVLIASQPLWAAPAAGRAATGSAPAPPAVEVVFVLDTTGSMGGLIAAAKEKIWSIANTLASGDPAPRIKMGLVGYRDRGDQYVTTVTPLSEDLDAVYATLMQFSADGGGDSPESVNQALHEAVSRTPWSTKNNTYRVIFLVGDAPPHMDYQNDVHYQKSCALAARKGVIINTIQCGDQADTRPFWQSIASLAEGQYFQVAQSGSAVLYDTPYDRKIADLSRALDETRIYYGNAAQQAEMEARKSTADKIYESAAPSAVAKRTIFNSKAAGATNFLGSRELVSEMAEGKVQLEDIKAEELPAAMQDMNRDARKKFIAAKARERSKLQSRIEDLSRQRQAYIAAKVKEEQGKGGQSLDARIYHCIRTQAAVKNIRYEGGPAY